MAPQRNVTQEMGRKAGQKMQTRLLVAMCLQTAHQIRHFPAWLAARCNPLLHGALIDHASLLVSKFEQEQGKPRPIKSWRSSSHSTQGF